MRTTKGCRSINGKVHVSYLSSEWNSISLHENVWSKGKYKFCHTTKVKAEIYLSWISREMRTKWILYKRDVYKRPPIDQLKKLQFQTHKTPEHSLACITNGNGVLFTTLAVQSYFNRSFRPLSYISYHVPLLFLSYCWLASWKESFRKNSVLCFIANRFF